MPAGQRVIRVVSNSVQITVLPGVPPAPEEWGQAVDGIQCRLQVEKGIWSAGEAPVVLADLRNDGEQEFLVTPAEQMHQIEVDGSWYRSAEPAELAMFVPRLSPGGRVNGIRFSLDGRWAKTDSGERLALAPGKHSVRVGVSVIRRDTPGTKPLRVVSPAVEIQILPPDPHGRERVAGAQAANIPLYVERTYEVGDILVPAP